MKILTMFDNTLKSIIESKVQGLLFIVVEAHKMEEEKLAAEIGNCRCRHCFRRL